MVEDQPLEDVEELKDMVKDFVLNFGKPKPEDVQLYNSLPASLRVKAQRSTDLSDSPREAVVSFKADRGTSYDLFVKILDQLQGAYYEIYAARIGISPEEFRNLDRTKPDQKRLYKKARDGISMNISIAEPTKIGGK